MHWALRIGDAITMFVGFAVPLLVGALIPPTSWQRAIVEAIVITVAGVWAMRMQGLWTSSVTSVRSVETSRIGRALVMVSLVALIADRKSPTMIRVSDLIVACVCGFVALVLWRAAYRTVLGAERRRGRIVSRVIVVGTGRQARELGKLFDTHRELGLRVVAVVGGRNDANVAGMGHLWKGTHADARAVLAATEAEMVILCASELDRALVNTLTRDEHERGRMVLVDPGLSGMDFRRMHATAIAHQPLLEVSAASLTGLQLATKRIFDLVVAGLIGLFCLPLLAAIALMIKLEDRGPILFRQKRVGRDGEVFEIFKFRTMVVDAEARLAELMQGNERTGPLFKMDRDPRITRIGRFLRATSLDELPQLFNVLGGSMSLVGPRPALPSEVAEFPSELQARHRVRPGITGLWQVEARDNPAFDAYIRLDLFYVENWSLALDMVILLGTVDQVFFRPLVKLLYRGEDAAERSAPVFRSVIDDAVSVA